MDASKLKFEFLLVHASATEATILSSFLLLESIRLVVLPATDEAVAYTNKFRGKIVGVASVLAGDDVNFLELVNQIRSGGSEIQAAAWSPTDLQSQVACRFRFDALFRERLSQLVENEDLLTAFADDIFPLMEKLETMLVALEEGQPAGEILPGYMRILHTIKGTAASVGFKRVAEFSHKYEDFITSFQKGQKSFDADSLPKVTKGFDQLKKVLQEAMNGITPEGNSEALVAIFNEHRGGESAKVPTAAKGPAGPPSANTVDEKIFVSLDLLNEFIDTSSRLITIRSAFHQAIDRLAERLPLDSDVRTLKITSRQFDKEITKLQVAAEDLRKVSLNTVFKPLRRMLRELTKSLGKKIRVEIEGEDLRVDRLLANILSNCLVHLLRNCVDHGIETPEERLPAGKSEEGLIHIKVCEIDGAILTEIEDDGKGIHPTVVRKKALQLGLYSEAQLNAMSENEIQAIIFAPGFSTAANISDVSGRGVGADMVKRSVMDAGGRLKLQSVVGRGTKFEVQLPIPNTSLVMQVILIEIGKYIFAVQKNDVVMVMGYAQGRAKNVVMNMDGGETVHFLEHYYPVLRPEFGDFAKSDLPESEACLILLHHEDQRFSVLADSILSNEECIGIRLDDFTMHGLKMFEKAMLLGNSKVAMLADCSTFLRLCDREPKREEGTLERRHG